MSAFDVTELIVASNEISDEHIIDVAEKVFEAVLATAPHYLGPTVSVNEEHRTISVLATVMADSQEQLREKAGRLLEIMLMAANDFEFAGSTTERAGDRELVA